MRARGATLGGGGRTEARVENLSEAKEKDSPDERAG